MKTLLYLIVCALTLAVLLPEPTAGAAEINTTARKFSQLARMRAKHHHHHRHHRHHHHHHQVKKITKKPATKAP